MMRIINVSLVAVILALLIACGGGGGDSPETANGAGDVHGAWVAIQRFVEDRLKSPSTAKFPFGGARDVTDFGDGRYQVASHVDAQNSFGATVRTKFKATVRKDGKRFLLIHLEFDGLTVAEYHDRIGKELREKEKEKVARDEAERIEKIKAAKTPDQIAAEAELKRKQAAALAALKAEETREKNERQAAIRLKFAKSFLDKGDKSTAKKRLLQIISENAGTPAAAEAAELLKTIRP